MKVLNIVNGDIVSKKLKDSNIQGDFLEWGDFMHEGPMPEGFSLESLSKIRAKYISSQSLGEFKEIYQSFKDRDSILLSSNQYDRVILWFENDMHDQLQLIQILNWFAQNSPNSNLYILYPDNYIICSTANELQETLLYNIEIVTHNHYIVAKKAWGAFTSKTPEAWYKLLDDDISSLPYLKDTVLRVLEEYPNTINGLSKTEYKTLKIISNGVNRPKKIFENYQKSEERAFMGEVIFWNRLKALVESNLLNSTQNAQNLQISPLGEEVLQCKKNWLKIKTIERWIGGVKLIPKSVWCWNIKSKKIFKYNYSLINTYDNKRG
jgi:hypothetical protein